MSIFEKKFTEKFRPKKLDNVVLLPKIRNKFTNGINNDYIFYGTSGLGKTTLAQALALKFGYDFKKINMSLDTGIDVLRNEISDFVNTYSLDRMFNDEKNSKKMVFLDEFEKASSALQLALKAFVEENSHIKFILSTNEFSKIDKNLLSRFEPVNFNPITVEESNYLRSEYMNHITKIVNTLIKSDSIQITDDEIEKIISDKFPDLRSVIVHIQEMCNIYINSKNNTDNELKTNSEIFDRFKPLRDLILDKSKTELEIYKFVMSNYNDNVDEPMYYLGRGFINYLFEKNINFSNELIAKILILVAEYQAQRTLVVDVNISLIALIVRIKNILNI